MGKKQLLFIKESDYEYHVFVNDKMYFIINGSKSIWSVSNQVTGHRQICYSLLSAFNFISDGFLH